MTVVDTRGSNGSALESHHLGEAVAAVGVEDGPSERGASRCPLRGMGAAMGTSVLHGRAVEAAIWGQPIVMFDATA
jgi:hypothetical protein